jgi:hypothetical protein
MRRTIRTLALTGALLPMNVTPSSAQPVDARAASQAFNNLSTRMQLLEQNMEALDVAWETMLGAAVIGFQSARCPNGWAPYARSNALLVTGPDGSKELLELKNVPGAEIGRRTGTGDGVPAQKLLFCVRAKGR